MGRLIFTTFDGVLIMDRSFDESYWENDPEFLDYSLKIDAREHGVRIVSYAVDRKAKLVDVIVDWL